MHYLLYFSISDKCTTDFNEIWPVFYCLLFFEKWDFSCKPVSLFRSRVKVAIVKVLYLQDTHKRHGHMRINRYGWDGCCLAKGGKTWMLESGDYSEYSCPEKKTEKTRNNETFGETDYFITMSYVPFHCFISATDRSSSSEVP